jgi:hypothetical protein
MKQVPVVHWMEFLSHVKFRQLQTQPFLLPPNWDGWPLNSHHIFINYIKFPLLRSN